MRLRPRRGLRWGEAEAEAAGARGRAASLSLLSLVVIVDCEVSFSAFGLVTPTRVCLFLQSRILLLVPERTESHTEQGRKILRNGDGKATRLVIL